MNLSRFRYFLAVAQEMNITKASQKLYITQQSLSEHIKRLEDEYQVKLFDRTPRLRLTYAGEIMLGFADQVINLETEIENAMSDITGLHRGMLLVGIRPSHSKILIPKILPIFNRKYPYIKINFLIYPSNEIAQLLLNGQLDIGIISPRYAANSHFISVKIYTDNYCMVIPENILHDSLHISSKDLQRGKTPDFSCLANVPLIMTKPGGATREIADNFLLSLGITQPNILMETTGFDFDTNFIMSSNGIGITFGFDLFFNYFIKNYSQNYKLYKIPIKTTNRNPDMMICYHRKRFLNHVAKEFIEVTKDIASKL